MGQQQADHSEAAPFIPIVLTPEDPRYERILHRQLTGLITQQRTGAPVPLLEAYSMATSKDQYGGVTYLIPQDTAPNVYGMICQWFQDISDILHSPQTRFDQSSPFFGCVLQYTEGSSIFHFFTLRNHYACPLSMTFTEADAANPAAIMLVCAKIQVERPLDETPRELFEPGA